MNDSQAIELFHLLFLHALGARVSRALYVLKGGCNLRFYWKSIRYSEDLDLDVHTMSAPTLRRNVEHVLTGPSLPAALSTHGLELVGHSAPKQTNTTQRWKVSLRQRDGRRALPTKIEFSRRRPDPGAEVGPVDAALLRQYRLYPVLAQHYGRAAAFKQKVAALARRAQTQARDVFDLKLLLDQGVVPESNDALRSDLRASIANAMSVGYDQFAGQVLAYLEPEYQEHYRGREVWDSLQAEVVQRLEGLAAP
jgi:hypothetical protein